MMKGVYFDRENSVQSAPRIILVEGPDDGYFLDAVLGAMQISTDKVRVLLTQGKDRMGGTLRPILKSHAFTSGAIERYAIIRDADDDASIAISDTHAFLKNMGEPLPSRSGLQARKDGRQVGLFLFPNSSSSGDLETLCMATVTNSNRTLAENFVSGSAETGGFQDHFGKRLAQSYLAISSKPLCSGVGWAATKGAFDLNHAAVDDLKVFLNKFL